MKSRVLYPLVNDWKPLPLPLSILLLSPCLELLTLLDIKNFKLVPHSNSHSYIHAKMNTNFVNKHCACLRSIWVRTYVPTCLRVTYHSYVRAYSRRRRIRRRKQFTKAGAIQFENRELQGLLRQLVVRETPHFIVRHTNANESWSTVDYWSPLQGRPLLLPLDVFRIWLYALSITPKTITLPVTERKSSITPLNQKYSDIPFVTKKSFLFFPESPRSREKSNRFDGYSREIYITKIPNSYVFLPGSNGDG